VVLRSGKPAQARMVVLRHSISSSASAWLAYRFSTRMTLPLKTRRGAGVERPQPGSCRYSTAGPKTVTPNVTEGTPPGPSAYFTAKLKTLDVLPAAVTVIV